MYTLQCTYMHQSLVTMAPAGQGSRGDIDFSLCKAQVCAQHCRDIFLVNTVKILLKSWQVNVEWNISQFYGTEGTMLSSKYGACYPHLIRLGLQITGAGFSLTPDLEFCTLTFYSLTPRFCKVSLQLCSKTPNFVWKMVIFYSRFLLVQYFVEHVYALHVIYCPKRCPHFNDKK